jgi:hypothetical protein
MLFSTGQKHHMLITFILLSDRCCETRCLYNGTFVEWNCETNSFFWRMRFRIHRFVAAPTLFLALCFPWFKMNFCSMIGHSVENIQYMVQRGFNNKRGPRSFHPLLALALRDTLLHQKPVRCCYNENASLIKAPNFSSVAYKVQQVYVMPCLFTYVLFSTTLMFSWRQWMKGGKELWPILSAMVDP